MVHNHFVASKSLEGAKLEYNLETWSLPTSPLRSHACVVAPNCGLRVRLTVSSTSRVWYVSDGPMSSQHVNLAPESLETWWPLNLLCAPPIYEHPPRQIDSYDSQLQSILYHTLERQSMIEGIARWRLPQLPQQVLVLCVWQSWLIRLQNWQLWNFTTLCHRGQNVRMHQFLTTWIYKWTI